VVEVARAKTVATKADKEAKEVKEGLKTLFNRENYGNKITNISELSNHI